MNIVNTLKLNSNKKIEINFDGGELSSNSGLLLMKEFLSAIGLTKILENTFRTTDMSKYRIHNDIDNLLQSLCQIFAGYFEDDRADDLRNEPVMTGLWETRRSRMELPLWGRRIPSPALLQQSYR